MIGIKVKRLPNILILGHGRSGKDSVAEMLSEYGFKFVTSSYFCAEKIMMPYFNSIGTPYETVDDCYNDRMNHRKAWFDQITLYNSGQWDKLSKEILQDHEIYVGMRNDIEFLNSKYLYQHVVWIDASKRVPPEDTSSCRLTPEDADYILDNNGTLEDLDKSVKQYIGYLLKTY